MSGAARRLLELEASGVEFSRNKNFQQFESGLDREAFLLRKRLDGWAGLLRSHRDADALQLEVEWTEDFETVVLSLELPELEGMARVRLHRDELALLLREEDLATLLGPLPSPP